MRKILFSGAGTKYLLDDEFRDNRTAGAVNGTPATPGPGVRTVVDAGNRLTIAGGLATFAAGGGAGDPGIWWGSFARQAGRVFIAEVTKGALTTVAAIGFDTNQAGGDRNSIRISSGSASIICSIQDTVQGPNIGIYATATSYKTALVDRGTGIYAFIKGGAYTGWTLLWSWLTADTPFYPVIQARGVDTFDFARVPAALWLPTPLAYDTFTRGDGALGSSESTGPDSQAVTSRVWTGATWAISTNAAVNTPSLGAEQLADPGLEANYTAGKCDSLGNSGSPTLAQSADVHGGAKAQSLTATVQNDSVSYSGGNPPAGTWVQGSIWAKRTAGANGGVLVRLREAGVSNSGTSCRLTSAVYAQYVFVRRFTDGTHAFGIDVMDDRAAGFDTAILDDFSIQYLTLSTLFTSITSTHADVIVDAAVTLANNATVVAQAGIVLRLDSAASPANFLLAYLTTTPGASTISCVLEKCVGGTYTSLISAAVTYVAGATLRVIASGTSVSVYYNNAQVGTTQTVADAGILNNTLHGLFSTSASNSLDGFSVYPRGTSNEYAALDKWSGTNP